MISIKKRRDRELGFAYYDVYITRGDSGYISFDLVDKDGNSLALSDGEVIRCSVKEEPDGAFLFSGVADIEEGCAIWSILPENTKNAAKDLYYWDAQIELANGDIFTFIPVSKFNILPEITEKGD